MNPTLLSDTMAVARRNVEHIRQIPEKLLDVTLQPLMFVLLFSFVFGKVIDIPGGGDYTEYLMGGILAQTIAFGMMGPGVSIATDLGEGIIDRFRSLPMHKSAYLLGHLVAELGASCLAIAILMGSGLIVGWGIHASLLGALGGIGLSIVFAFTMIWIGTMIGVMVRSPDAVQGFAFVVIFPLTFVAVTFVPIDGLEGVLGTIASWNPVSAVATALRQLFGNPTAIPDGAAWPLQHAVLVSLVWCAALLAVAIPVTMRRFEARTTD